MILAYADRDEPQSCSPLSLFAPLHVTLHQDCIKTLQGCNTKDIAALHPSIISDLQLKLAQDLAPDCLVLLHTIADALREWSASVSRASQQQQQQQQQQAVAEVLQTGTLLSHAASSLLHCIHAHELWHAIGGQQLLDALRQLLQTVLLCLPVHLHIE